MWPQTLLNSWSHFSGSNGFHRHSIPLIDCLSCAINCRLYMAYLLGCEFPRTSVLPCPLLRTMDADALTPQIVKSEPSTQEKAPSVLDEKSVYSGTDIESTTSSDVTGVLKNERDLVTHVISLDDDPSLSPWTFRSLFIGIGLSAFGGVLGKFTRYFSSSLY